VQLIVALGGKIDKKSIKNGGSHMTIKMNNLRRHLWRPHKANMMSYIAENNAIDIIRAGLKGLGITIEDNKPKKQKKTKSNHKLKG